MQTRFSRGGVAIMGALAALACSVTLAAPATPQPETSLLGIRLRSSFSDVLRKFGQPDEIQVGDPTVSSATMSGNGLPGFGGPGGMPGFPGMGGGAGKGFPGGGAPGMPGMNRGFPGAGGPGGYPGTSGAPGMPGMNRGFPGAGSPGGYPGTSGAPGMPGMNRGGGLPGFKGGDEGGSQRSPGFPGAGNGPSSGSNGSAESDETTWWYHYPKLGLHYSFLFNKQGKVIQIQAYGYKPSGKAAPVRTVQGITLGDPLGRVIQRYGWSGDGENNGDYVVLRYGSPDQVAFQSKRNKIIGIVLGVVNN